MSDLFLQSGFPLSYPPAQSPLIQLPSVLIPLQLFLVSPLTALIPSLNMYLFESKFFPRLKATRCICASSWDPSLRDPLSSILRLSSSPSHLYFTRMVSFLTVTNLTKLKHLHRAASHAISGSLSSSSIPLLLYEVSLSPYESS